MAFCKKCGAQMADDAKFCPKCGETGEAAAQSAADKAAQIMDTPDTTGQYTAEDINQNKVMAVLAYFGILVLVPIFAAKESKFARFHANQGLVLCIGMVAYSIVQWILVAIFTAISWALGAIISTILSLVWILFGVLAIIGIINSAQGKAKELPIIGKINILK